MARSSLRSTNRFNKPINFAQQMIARDAILQAQLIKQLRLIVLLSSHPTVALK
jgi:hypothetical protein